MKPRDTFNRFQENIFQRIEEAELARTQWLVNTLIKVAATVGYSIDDLIAMIDSGMKMPEITDCVWSRLPCR